MPLIITSACLAYLSIALSVYICLTRTKKHKSDDVEMTELV